MIMGTSEDILQAKEDNIIGESGVVNTYIDDILVLSKYIFPKHIENLIVVFYRLNIE